MRTITDMMNKRIFPVKKVLKMRKITSVRKKKLKLNFGNVIGMISQIYLVKIMPTYALRFFQKRHRKR